MKVAFKGHDRRVNGFIGKLWEFIEAVEEGPDISREVIHLVRKVLNVNDLVHNGADNVRGGFGPPPATASTTGRLSINNGFPGGS